MNTNLEKKNCLVCGADDYQLFLEWPANLFDHQEYITYSWDAGLSIPLRIVKCNNCGLVYTNPSIKEDSLSLVYPQKVVPAFSKEELQELTKSKKWDSIIESIVSILHKESTIVDIGTRYGVLPYQLQSLGYQSFGIDYNPKSIEVANRILPGKNFTGGIPDLKNILEQIPGVNSINAFVLNDVLEHLAYPIRDLQILNQSQKKGDFLFLRQMDLDSYGAKLYGKNWYYYQPAAHMAYYNEHSVKNLLQKVGYKVVLIKKEYSLRSSLKVYLKNNGIYVDNVGTLKGLLLLLYLSFQRKNSKQRGFSEASNSLKMYLEKRRRLKDMFLVIAQKS